MGWVDLHSHIAWGLDDGFRDREESRLALELAQKDGITCICSTPHFVPGQDDASFLKTMSERQEELRVLAEEYGIQIFSGAEMFMNFSFTDYLRKGLYKTLGDSSYMLCEFDVTKDIHSIEWNVDSLYEIKVRNMIPVLAHAERYFHGRLDYELLDAWKDMGVIMHVNRASLLGLNGKTMQKNAWILLEKGYASFVCSDAHRALHVRQELLKDVHEAVVQRLGQENADLLLIRNPLHILHGEKVESLSIKKKRFFLFNK